MTNIKINIAVLSAVISMQACRLNNVVEPDPIFQEKKRPSDNKIIMNKARLAESDYQEKNKGFVNDYSEINAKKNEEMLFPKKVEPQVPFAIQRIREEAPKNTEFAPRLEQRSTPQEPVAPVEREYTPVTQQQFAQTQPQPTQQMQAPVANMETFEIQAGSYQSEAGAMKIVQKFESAGVKNVRINKVDGKNTVRINNNGQPFKTRDEASKMLQDIIEKTQHYDIMVVKNKI